MRFGVKNLIITMLIVSLSGISAHAESLFTSGISQNIYAVTPKSLYSTVKAKNIGDFITILVDESITTSDDTKLTVNNKSSITDGFSTFINKLFPRLIPTEIDDYGGQNTVGNSAKSSRTTKYNYTITAQVVQVLPNGNMLVKGKRTAINSGEKVDIIVSGIVDPRFVDYQGRIKSSQVANLQFALNGEGTISNSEKEGILNQLRKWLF